jgi:hypothetical protein
VSAEAADASVARIRNAGGERGRDGSIDGVTARAQDLRACGRGLE